MEVFWTGFAAIAAAVAVLTSGIIAWRQNRYVARQTAAADAQVESARRQAAAADAQVEFARKQLEVAEQVWKEGAQPSVYADVTMSKRNSQMLVMTLQNTGPSAARNVKVWTEPTLPNHAGVDISRWDIPTLWPNAYFERTITTGRMFYNEEKDWRPELVTVHVQASGPFGDLEDEVYQVNLEELGKVYSAAKWTETTPEELGKIRSQLTDVARSLKTIALAARQKPLEE